VSRDGASSIASVVPDWGDSMLGATSSSERFAPYRTAFGAMSMNMMTGG
jgi:hypothetical protein